MLANDSPRVVKPFIIPMDGDCLMALEIGKYHTHGNMITTCEMHTGGEPLRILESGGPNLKGKTILEKIKDFRQNYDNIRK